MNHTRNSRSWWRLAVVGACCLGILAGCADALPDEEAAASDAAVMIPIETVLEVVATENDVARGLYTSNVVGPGLAGGIAFNEDWAEPDVFAGPLPALFLRGASNSLSKSETPLGLFLGSDFPISSANAFSDIQQEKFELIRADGQPQFFFDDELSLHTAMFEDVAVAEPCVSCHNEHPETTKGDWAMGDIMGATTWTYPKEQLTVAEFYEVVNAYRSGVRDSYDSFIAEIEDWDEKPEVGDVWPSESDFAVPSTDVFMERFEQMASAATLEAVFAATAPQEA